MLVENPAILKFVPDLQNPFVIITLCICILITKVLRYSF